MTSDETTSLVERTERVVREVALPLDDAHDGDIEAAGGEAARSTLQDAARAAGVLRPARAGRLRRPRPGHGPTARRSSRRRATRSSARWR